MDELKRSWNLLDYEYVILFSTMGGFCGCSNLFEEYFTIKSRLWLCLVRWTINTDIQQSKCLHNENAN